MTQAQTSERVWTKDHVLALIATNEIATARALTVLYSRQTLDEQHSLKTIESNGRGFNGRDAHVLSDIARKLPRYNNRMTPRQLAYVRKALPKYWRQLLDDMEQRGLKVEWPNGKKQALMAVEGMEAPRDEIEAERHAEGAWLRHAEREDHEAQEDLRRHENAQEQFGAWA